MKHCIICRKPKTTFSDEHVIPDSIKGYYHIYSVCEKCNSELGRNVDSKLVNHKFIEFQRHLLGIKGKSGSIPNPFSGTQHLEADPEQKVVVAFDEDGKLIPKLLPRVNVNKDREKLQHISFTLDAKDEHLKEQIIAKILKRNGIDRSTIQFTEKREKPERPWIETTMTIDIKDFRIGLLKIAYEFAIDTIESYYDDETAISISQILLNADLERMDRDVVFYGSGLTNNMLEPLTHFFDFSNNNHYLFLLSIDDIGLICQINLFNSISIGIKLSDHSNHISETIIGINDITKGRFEKLTLDQVIKRVFSPIEYRFQYWFETENDVFQFLDLQQNAGFDFYREKDKIPFFNQIGMVVYENIDDKLKQEQLYKVDKGDFFTEIITQIELDEELYIKLHPGLNLYRVVSVQLEQKRTSKL